MRHPVFKRRQMERCDDGPHGLVLERNKAGIELSSWAVVGSGGRSWRWRGAGRAGSRSGWEAGVV